MGLTEFTLAVAIVSIPGIICYFIFGQLTGRRNTNSVFESFLQILVYSLLSYAIVIFFDKKDFNAFITGVLSKLSSTKAVSPSINIFLAYNTQFMHMFFCSIGIGIILAYILSYGWRFKVINWVGKVIGATKRYGDEDVWQYFHDVPLNEKNNGWLIIRDHKTNLAYHASVTIYSESEKDREMILDKVTVFTNDTSDFLYECDHIYLCRNKDDITIEVPPVDAPKFPQYNWEGPVDVKGAQDGAKSHCLRDFKKAEVLAIHRNILNLKLGLQHNDRRTPLQHSRKAIRILQRRTGKGSPAVRVKYV